MAHISIALDRWKLPIYQRILTEAGYACQAGQGMTVPARSLKKVPSA